MLTPLKRRGGTKPDNVVLTVGIKFHPSFDQVIVDVHEHPIAARQLALIKAKAAGC